jgi:hypothetical protein
LQELLDQPRRGRSRAAARANAPYRRAHEPLREVLDSSVP